MQDRIKIKDVFIHPWVMSFAKAPIIKNELKVIEIEKLRRKSEIPPQQESVLKKINTEREKDLSRFINNNQDEIDCLINRKESKTIFDKVLKKVEEKNLEKRKVLQQKNQKNLSLDCSKNGIKDSENSFNQIEKSPKENISISKNVGRNNNDFFVRTKTKLKTADIIQKAEINVSKELKKHYANSASKNGDKTVMVSNSSASTTNSNSTNKVNLVNSQISSLMNSPPISLKRIEINLSKENNMSFNKTPTLKCRQISLFKKAYSSNIDAPISTFGKSQMKANSYEEKSSNEETQSNLAKLKKKELINRAALDILEKTDMVDLINGMPNMSIPVKKESTIWSKISDFFTPKCTQNK